MVCTPCIGLKPDMHVRGMQNGSATVPEAAPHAGFASMPWGTRDGAAARAEPGVDGISDSLMHMCVAADDKEASQWLHTAGAQL